MTSEPENAGLDRVRYELRAAGAKTPEADPRRSGVHTRGYLPHVKVEGAEYFITFRLADSLPREVLIGYEAEKAERLRVLHRASETGAATADTASEIQRDFRRRIERYLDQGAGECHLRRPEIAVLVVNALKFFHEQRYLLREWVVMPNHVHVVVLPLLNHLVGDSVKSWKQFTSREAKKILALPAGRFWQPEAYDHWIRNDEERARIGNYIRRNPVTAGLCREPEDWRWSSATAPA